MDKAMKERGNLASATVRKQRMQERQKQSHLMHAQREERKERLRNYSDAYAGGSGSDDSRSNSPENDSAADTPSECSISTPDKSFSPDVEIKVQAVDVVTQNPLRKEQETPTARQSTLLERRRSKLKSSQPTMLGASLNRPCDFRYDRFSTVVDPVDIPKQEEDDAATSSPSPDGENEEEDEEEDEDEDDYSPIEVATPVAIRMPISKPSMVSVVSSGPEHGPQKFSVQNINTIMINSPKPRPMPPAIQKPQNSRPLLQQANSSGFLASEAKRMEVHTPSESVVSVGPLSTQSLPSIELSSDNSLKKKSSMPMLKQFTHSRMNSIKNLMKPQSTSGEQPAVPAIPQTHQSRSSMSVSQILSMTPSHKSKSSTDASRLLSISSTHKSAQSVDTAQLLSPSSNHKSKSSLSAANILNSSHASHHRNKPSHVDKSLPTSPRRSLTEPHIPKATSYENRPQTARACSQTSITALPPPPALKSTSAFHSPTPSSLSHTTTLVSQSEDQHPPQHEVTRKKSFSNLRRRSGSLGQALKGLGVSSMSSKSSSRPLATETPVPPMPRMSVQVLPKEAPPPAKREAEQKASAYPTPPPKTPRSTRKSGMGMYTAFPPPRTPNLAHKGEKEIIGLGLRM